MLFSGMQPVLFSILSALILSTSLHAQLGPNGATASWKGALPPKPTADLSSAQQTAIESRLGEVTRSFQAVRKHPRAADADIFLKAVRYALEFHEWYDKKPDDGVKKANALLDEAEKRIAALKENQTPWMDGSGQKVLGFYSNIDDSPQPYGVEIPEGLEWGAGKKPVPMWIWLHGRGDTATDLHFIHNKLTAKKPGQFQPKGTIVIHPFGRYCNGWKSAGETDVFEARDDATARFNIDKDRIALAGFSMGGAGAWHIGAHFADQWACVHTGAGFVDVKRYQKLTPDKMPPWYEQKLWGVYDVPDYARNFFNVPLICYSGENDAQRDSAEYMMEVLGKEGLKPPHLIGAGVGHQYHPETIKEVQRLIEEAVSKGRDPTPRKVTLQTRTIEYARMFWITLTAQTELWRDSRIDADIDAGGQLTIKTTNVRGFDISPPHTVKSLVIDDTKLLAQSRHLRRDEQGRWVARDSILETKMEHPHGKHPRRAGPIEIPLKRPFMVVLPDILCASAHVDAWVKAESQNFLQRWRSLMRGNPRVKTASRVTDNDMQLYTLVLWGDVRSNPLIAKVLAAKTIQKLPVAWDEKRIQIGEQSFDATTHVPVMIRPNPLEPRGLIILNSGLTFREAHDRTNSLQNPKLPDWAILDISQPPNAESAGKVVAADFFDEHWQVIPRMKSPQDRE